MPTYAELLERTDAPKGSSWFCFGADNQLGSLNFLAPDRARQAAMTIRTGESLGLDYAVNAFDPPIGGSRKLAEHHVFANGPNHRDDWMDSFYLQSTTQIDGLRHIRDPEHGFYGGVADEEVAAGSPALGIQAAASNGIVGRGVLLDVEHYLRERGDALDPTSNRGIGPAELEAVAAAQHVELLPGDILLIRTGWAEHYQQSTRSRRIELSTSMRTPGLEQSRAMLAWLWDHQLALVAADNPTLEAFPPDMDSDIVPAPEPAPDRGPSHRGMAHRPLIALLGVYIGELWKLDELAEACRRDGRYDFFLTAKPLGVVGGVGSPANAIAIR